MASDNTLSWMERDPFIKLFNRGGYVLDFNDFRFDAFTQESVGVPLLTQYGLSKGKSLEKFANEAPRNVALKLFSDLMDYYEYDFIRQDDNDADYQRLYKRCKEILSSTAQGGVGEAGMFFNVIIRFDESQAISPDRMFEGTPSQIAARFKNYDGSPNFELLRTLPTITTREFYQDDSVVARLGYLGPGPTHQLSEIIEEFPAMKLNDILPQNGWLGSRTRWMVLAGDPYRLLGNVQENYQTIQNPAVIQFPRIPVNEKQIAVMMPFNSSYFTPSEDPVYKAIKMAGEQAGFSCVRADEIRTPTDIKDDIFKLIEGSKIIVADLSGGNRNVYYEMGLAHARGRIVIPISGDDEKLPFDIGHIRTVFFHRYIHGIEGLTCDLTQVLKAVS
ncbi:hypothetical protein [Alloscardovia omnicolens]|uniref:hypothetical protein n=1 Tax=Alloscardovia omnicolens TaxID=419015 RepID=UPI00254B0956|nr:hypothetical protein [Alloscardovia omnicolens]MDK8081537.1 hypothetical protein [Alloscardovia omnicolens]